MDLQTNLVIDANDAERIQFYKRTYLHVAFALLGFIIVEAFLIKVVPTEIVTAMISNRILWLAIIGIFWLIGSFTDKLAFSPNRNSQYLGLGLYVVVEAIVFLPLIYIAWIYSDGESFLSQATILTLAMFTGLTALVFFSKQDFSFLRTGLIVAGFISLGLIAAGAIFGFDLGLWFSVIMVLVASGGVLYQTSLLKDHFGTDQYVGASLKLFASIMLLFWYILRILIARRR